jgi:phenol 2-monooxygenase
VQFHLNGFQPGDPEIFDPAERKPAQGAAGPLPQEVDVLIVGCGPAGLTLGAQLAAFTDIKTCIVEQKPGPLLCGQADGVSCRTMEMFEAFGFSDRLMKEACWINESRFWKPDDKKPEHIVRSGWVQDVEDGLSEFPHVVLNQARVHDFYLELMRRSPAKLAPHYARRFIDLAIDNDPGGHNADLHHVTARLERIDPGHEGEIETVKARYVVGCDGARSAVRKSLGHALLGDSTNHAWGVMDVLATTDFPDVRCKTLIQSAMGGSIIIIPREGGYLFRLYIEMEKLKVGERVSNRNITADDLIASARRIFNPYSLDVKEIAWWSVYEIGQRLCDKFDDVAGNNADRLPCVFIAGDACHTHSPKAGQGMNVSMQDAFNLGWKLAAVLRRRCTPHLLRSYSMERQVIAKELIDFDREWAQVISSSAAATGNGKPSDSDLTKRYYAQHLRYTAGTVTRYRPSLLTGGENHQQLALGFKIGMRFHSAPVIRVADAKAVQLGHTIKADGRWRIFAFAPAEDPSKADSVIHALCSFLENDPQSPLKKYTPAGEDIDAMIDIRAVFQQGHHELEIGSMPPLLIPRKGRYGLRDYEKTFSPDQKNGQDIFDMRGVDRQRGCLVIVRPDQFVAHILPLDSHGELACFFDGFMLQPA